MRRWAVLVSGVVAISWITTGGAALAAPLCLGLVATIVGTDDGENLMEPTAPT